MRMTEQRSQNFIVCLFTLPVRQKILRLQTKPGQPQWPSSMLKMKNGGVDAPGWPEQVDPSQPTVCLRSSRIAWKRGVEGAEARLLRKCPRNLTIVLD